MAKLLGFFSSFELILIAIAALGLSYVGVGYHYYEKGKAVQFALDEKATFEAYKAGTQSRKEIDLDVKRLTVSDVDKHLCSGGWVRDSASCK